MRLIRAIVKPNGYNQHHRIFTFPKEGREIVVDPAATKSVDEPGKPLLLTKADYEYVKQEAGGSIVIEPLEDAEGGSAVERISDLTEQLDSARSRVTRLERRNAEVEAAHEKARAEHENERARADRLERDLDGAEEAYSQLKKTAPDVEALKARASEAEQKLQVAEQALAKAKADTTPNETAAFKARIGELETQLAAATKPKK